MVRAGVRLRHTMVAALALALALTGCTDRGTARAGANGLRGHNAPNQ